MNSNIHKYIFDKQDDEIFSKYHDTVAGGVSFFTANFWGNSFASMTDVDKIPHLSYSFSIEKGPTCSTPAKMSSTVE